MREVLRRILFLPPEASTFSTRVDNLHFFVITVTMVASAMVGLVAVYFMVRYRRRPEHRTTPHVEPSKLFEFIIISGPLSLFLLWFAIGFKDFVYLQSPPKDSMDVYVMAKKWMWKFSYPGGPSSVAQLVVPAGRPVRLLLTSRDVIHSFYVSAFRIKQDALPGRYTQTWFEATAPGRYQVLCAEYCGAGHSFMRAEVVVLRPEEFEDWLQQQKRGALVARQDASDPDPQQSTIVEQGRLSAVKYGCLKCHSIDGSAHIGPTWLDLYDRPEKLEGGQSVVADEAYLTESMMDPGAKIVAGFQNVMPTFQGTLPAPEAAAIVEYIKSLRSERLQPTPSQPPIFHEQKPSNR